MKKLLRAFALAAVLTFGACSVAGCGTANPGTVALQGEAAGYDTIKGFADEADTLCVAGTLDHDKCVVVKHDIRTAKTLLDEGKPIADLVVQITGELK